MRFVHSLLACACLTAGLSVGPDASAEPPSKEKIVRALMVVSSPVDTIALRQSLANPSQILCDIAWDDSVHAYARQRASAALTEMDDDTAFQCLQRLASDAAVPASLRRYSLYAFARRYAAERPDRVMPLLDKSLRSSDADEREKAVRALAYAKPIHALPLLEAFLKTEKSERLLRLAQTRIKELRKPSTGM